MIALTTIQCPRCMKIFITKIIIRKTIVGGRPTLMFPAPNCNGVLPDGADCEFDWQQLDIESFDIPIDASKIIGATR